MLSVPSPGSMNFVKHLMTKDKKPQGESVTNGGCHFEFRNLLICDLCNNKQNNKSHLKILKFITY